jgi:hypothetical protein
MFHRKYVMLLPIPNLSPFQGGSILLGVFPGLKPWASMRPAVPSGQASLFEPHSCEANLVSLAGTAAQQELRPAAGTLRLVSNTFLEGYPELPFGGFKESGQDREVGRFAIEEFTEPKTIQLHIGKKTSWWAKTHEILP